MTVWFTADTHFGHARIIELAKRPFDSVEVMDEWMIQAWNEVVEPTDTVYHLGDFSFADQRPYLDRLKGQKRLIIGNHDHSNRIKKARITHTWQHVSDIEYINVDGQQIVLFHYGMRVWRNSGHGALHFYGHSHNNLEGDAQSCDVGVDSWNFRPVTLESIKQRLAKYPPRIEPDHH